MMRYAISLVLISLCVVNGDNVGWLKQFDDNPTEFHDIPLEWENGRRTNIPSWLYGTYIRNGPAQVYVNINFALKIDDLNCFSIII